MRIGRPPRRTAAVWLVAFSCALAAQAGCGSRLARGGAPESLSSEEFWRISAAASELPGQFWPSDNLVSNERRFAHTIGRLRTRGGAYVGVGPEQNFSFIAALRPHIAFVVDIREGNRRLHLMYKALFELSSDRVDFVSRLFSRPPPPGLDRAAGVHEIFGRYAAVPASAALYDANAASIRRQLLEVHGWPLTAEDLAAIGEVYRAFYSKGPDIHYERADTGHPPDPSYAQLMTGSDIWSRPGSFLATEERFAFVKGLQARNLIVPMVGDFAGPHALRRVGAYLREWDVPLAAFYASNVEAYLHSRQMAAFCGNLATLPSGSRSAYIDSRGLRPFADRLRTCQAPPANPGSRSRQP